MKKSSSKYFTLKEFVNDMKSNKESIYYKLLNSRGLGESSANIICNEYKYFEDDIDYIINNCTVIDSKNITIRKQRIKSRDRIEKTFLLIFIYKLKSLIYSVPDLMFHP